MTDKTIPGASTAALGLANDVDKRLSIHEAVCAERYGALLARMGRIERIMIAVAGFLLAALAKLVFWP